MFNSVILGSQFFPYDYCGKLLIAHNLLVLGSIVMIRLPHEFRKQIAVNIFSIDTFVSKRIIEIRFRVVSFLLTHNFRHFRSYTAHFKPQKDPNDVFKQSKWKGKCQRCCKVLHL